MTEKTWDKSLMQKVPCRVCKAPIGVECTTKHPSYHSLRFADYYELCKAEEKSFLEEKSI